MRLECLKGKVIAIDEPTPQERYIRSLTHDYNAVTSENYRLRMRIRELLDKLADYAIMVEEERKKSNWVKGIKGLFAGSVPEGGFVKVGKKERARLAHQIATDFPNLTEGAKIYPYENRNHFYLFQVGAFGSYRFLAKIQIEGNEDLIMKCRKRLSDGQERG